MARGSIKPRQRLDGSTVYDIVYDVASPDGRRRQQRRTFRTRREAERALAEALRAVDRGELRASTGETFAAYAESWLAAKRARLEASTLRDYETHLRLRLVPAFGALRLERITRPRIEAYLAELDAAGTLSRKTINDSLIPLRGILARAVRERLLPSNPAASVDRDAPLELPYEQRPMRFLTREQVPAYLLACPAWYRPLAGLLIASGVRIGEALALQWSDVDWEGGGVRVARTLKVTYDALAGVGGTKGDRDRTVYIGPFALRSLAEHRASRMRLGGLIFATTKGTAFSRHNVRKRGHVVALEGAGLDRGVRLHDLRHTAATLWLASGESIYFVQQQLGHRDIQTTISLYGHPDQAAHRAAAERAEAWWRAG